MRDVAGNARDVEGLEAAVHGHTLVELPHLRQLQFFAELELPDEYDLQLPVRVGQDADLFEQRQRQILCLVDEDDGERLQRRERREKVVEQIAQLRARGRAQPSARQIFDPRDAEIGEQDLEQLLPRGERIRDEGVERLAFEVLQHRAAERRLAGADVAGEDRQAFAPFYGVQQIVERGRVRAALVEEPRIGRQAERLFLEAVERLVGEARAPQILGNGTEDAWAVRLSAAVERGRHV
jgi:hypothetical protein